MTDNKEPDFKEWALKYAALGFAVFPLKPHTKVPATPDGFKSATTDVEQIKSWWTAAPYNIGIATGTASGNLLVIDLDVDKDKGKDGKRAAMQWLKEHGKDFPKTAIAKTGRGGLHMLFYGNGRNKANLLPGVDVRGEGGYIVAPPSIHPNGNIYQWLSALKIAAADDTVYAFINQSESKAREAAPKGDAIPEGQRTNALIRLIGSLKAKGLSNEAIEAAVTAENNSCCNPPLTDQELIHQVFPAIYRGWETERPYYRTTTNVDGAIVPAKPRDHFDMISAKELQGLDIPPLEFIVDEFLPLGLTLLGAPPKSFKSYMCLQMCLCICQGFDFMGFKTQKCDCLYLDLESTRRRPKNRIDQILQGAEAPDNLHIVTTTGIMGKGFEEDLRQAKADFPGLKVVVVDVFKKIRPPAKKSIDPYERDYEDYGSIKAIADELGLAIILVTHTTKMKHPDDPFNELSGSSGTMGSIDVAMVIKKESREDKTAKLYITGRDLKDQCYEIEFDKEAFRWNKLGTHKDMEQLRLEYAYRNSPVVNTIKKLVAEHNGHWSGTVKEIIGASKYFKGMQIYDDPGKVGKEIRKFARWLAEWDFIEFHEDRDAKQRGVRFDNTNPFELSQPSSLSQPS